MLLQMAEFPLRLNNIQSIYHIFHYYILFIHSSVGKHFKLILYLGIGNNTTANTGI